MLFTFRFVRSCLAANSNIRLRIGPLLKVFLRRFPRSPGTVNRKNKGVMTISEHHFNTFNNFGCLRQNDKQIVRIPDEAFNEGKWAPILLTCQCRVRTLCPLHRKILRNRCHLTCYALIFFDFQNILGVFTAPFRRTFGSHFYTIDRSRRDFISCLLMRRKRYKT